MQKGFMVSPPTLKSWFFRSGWAILSLGCIYLFALTTTYFSFCSECKFLLKKQDVVFNPFWRTAFYIHITGGMLALATGPFQFIGRLRKRIPALHRVLGKIYLAAILILAGPSGQFMAFYAEGTWFASVGFLVMAILWLYTTWRAYTSVRVRDFAAHRNWMTRSFALTLAAVTLRTWVPIASYYLHIDDFWVIESSAWVSWIPNLLVAELLIRFSPKYL
jgi:uncharacterized membrane protein